MNLSRNTPEDSIKPFSKEALDYINTNSGELPRLVLRRLNYILERAADNLHDGDEITKEFVEQHLKN